MKAKGGVFDFTGTPFQGPLPILSKLNWVELQKAGFEVYFQLSLIASLAKLMFNKYLLNG